jgi:hypothetical protein
MSTKTGMRCEYRASETVSQSFCVTAGKEDVCEEADSTSLRMKSATQAIRSQTTIAMVSVGKSLLFSWANEPGLTTKRQNVDS